MSRAPQTPAELREFAAALVAMADAQEAIAKYTPEPAPEPRFVVLENARGERWIQDRISNDFYGFGLKSDKETGRTALARMRATGKDTGFLRTNTPTGRTEVIA